MTETAIAPPPALFRTDDDGVMHWFPHEFQVQARASLAARTFILKGWRGGWTSWSAKILETEMKRCGPGNLNLSYFAISPTHKVAEKGLIPAIQTVFCTHMGYAHYNKNEKTFIITPEGERALWGHAQKEPTKIVCCYAEDPESFASMTAISGVADEVGQKKFKYESWSTLEARCATTSGMVAPNNVALGFPRDLKMGRIFAGSTVYQLNWLEDLWNQWVAAMRKAETAKNEAIAATSDPQEQAEIEQEYRRKAYLGQIDPVNNFIRFDSTANPLISKEFFDGKRRSLQKWFFDMRYRAIFRKPAGVIFEEWNAQKHVISPREGLGRYVARRWKKWPRDIYIDFGKRNFHAQLWVIDEERNRFFLIASYHDSHLTNIERAKLLVDAWGIPERCVAGQISEDADRAELVAGGLVAVAPAFKDLWTGINNVASAIKQNRIFVFDDVPYDGMPPLLNPSFRIGSRGFRDEVRTYSRPVDEKGEVLLDKDPEDKESYHCFVAGTLIETNRGNIPIETVQKSDLALTRQGFKPVAKVGSYYAPAIKEVLFSDGRRLVGTADHPIWVEGKGFTPIDSLRGGDIIVLSPRAEVQSCVSQRAKKLFSMASSFADTLTRPVPVTGSILSIKAKAFIVKCISISSVIFPQEWTFITKTAILSITLPKISSLSAKSSINLKSTEATALLPNAPILPAFGHWLQNGIVRPRERSGTARQHSEHGKTGRWCPINASSAAVNTKPSIQAAQDFAEVHVKKNGAAKTLCTRTPALTVTSLLPVLTGEKLRIALSRVRQSRGMSVIERQEKSVLRKLKKPAHNAASYFRRVAMSLLNPAPTSVLRVCDHPGAVVYNFAVNEVPEYFANGILVHNSIDPLRGGLSWRFSYLSASDMTPRTGPGRAAPRETAPAPEAEAMMIRAGAGGSGFMDSIADRYGMGYDRRQPYIDIDL